MLFESEEKALHFLEYNTEDILENSEKAPVRAYFCSLCNGWHLTSSEHARSNYLSQGERVMLISLIFSDMEKCLFNLKRTENLEEGLNDIKNFSRLAHQAKTIKEKNLVTFEKMFSRARKWIHELSSRTKLLIKSHIENNEHKEAIRLIEILYNLSKVSYLEEVIGDDKEVLENYVNNRIKEIEDRVAPNEDIENLKNSFAEKSDLAYKLINFNDTSDAIKVVDELTEILKRMEGKLKKDSIGFYKYHIKRLIQELDHILTEEK